MSIRLFLPLLLAALLAGQSRPPAAKDARHDWLVVPGVRVGPITAKTKKSDLRRLFGAKNVVHTRLHVEGGVTAPGTVIYGFFAERRLEILWQGPDVSSTSVQICGPSLSRCEWHTAEGVTIGTDLKTVERLNGRPFSMSGFGWEYAGGVGNWEGGRFGDPNNGFMVFFADGFTRVSSEEYDSIQGDGVFRSSSPVLQKMNPVILYLRQDWYK